MWTESGNKVFQILKRDIQDIKEYIKKINKLIAED